MEMVRLMKCAISCDSSCFDVSNTQIFQGLRGCSRNRFTISTEKDSTPRLTWIIIPSSPTIEQLLLLLSSPIIYTTHVLIKGISGKEGASKAWT